MPANRARGARYGTRRISCRWMHFSIGVARLVYVAQATTVRTLLDPLQEQVVWEQVIRESPAGDSLLRIPETARQRHGSLAAHPGIQAAGGWPLRGHPRIGRLCSLVARVSRAMRGESLVGAARLADVLADLVEARRISKARELFLAGFDELTPQQADFFDALGARTAFETDRYSIRRPSVGNCATRRKRSGPRQLGRGECSNKTRRRKSASSFRT